MSKPFRFGMIPARAEDDAEAEEFATAYAAAADKLGVTPAPPAPPPRRRPLRTARHTAG